MFIDQKIRFELIKKELFRPASRIFEVGCGNGELLGQLIAMGHDAQGCELSHEAITSVSSAALKSRIKYADGTQIPEPTGSYDIVVSSDVLEHIPPTLRHVFINEILRILKPNGKAVMTYWSRKTKAFRAYGSYSLLLRGNLPQWYIEHITLNPPTFEETHRQISEKGKILRSQRYQGPTNMLLSCLDHHHHYRFPRLHRALLANHKLILALDRLGGCTSELVVFSKKEESNVCDTPTA